MIIYHFILYQIFYYMSIRKITKALVQKKIIHVMHLTKDTKNDIIPHIHAAVVELADTPDLGSGVPDVQVQVLSAA